MQRTTKEEVIQNSEKYSIVENKSDTGRWFVPSKAEWSAFGDYLYKNLGVTTSTYNNFGLNFWYWSSTESGDETAYFVDFLQGRISDNYIYSGNDGCGIRLSTTF